MACCHRGPGALIRRGRASSSYISYYLATRAPPRRDGAAPIAAAGADWQSGTGLNLLEQGSSSCGKQSVLLQQQQQQRGGVAASPGAGDLVGNKHLTDFWWSRRASLKIIGASSSATAAFLKPISGGHQQQLQFARGYASDGDLPAHQEIGMPSLSPTMTQGNIAGWKKKEGDQVSAGDVLCEIETDKATIEMESMEEGFLAKIVVGDGAKDIKVGDTICIVVESKDDIPKFSNFQPSSGGGGPPASPPPKQEDAPKKESAPPPGDLPPHQEIGMPSLSPTMTQGNIQGWKKKEGDQVSAGDVLCEIETDKATIEMESMEEGYLAKIVVGDGAKDIKVGDTICIVVENKDDIPKFSNFQQSGGSGGQPASPPKQKESAPPPPSESKSSPPPPKSKSSPPPSSSGDRIFASPAAKKLAADRNVPLDSIRGTGPDGHIVKADIEDYLASGSSQAKQEAPAASTGKAAPADSEGLDYSNISSNELQKVTARRLVQSKQTIPHYYLTLDTKVDKILELQGQLNQSQEAAKREKLSIIDFVIKAAALATRKVPEVNSSWTEDAIRQYNNVNISVAIQSEQMVPVVKEADRKGLSAISEEVKVLVEKANSNSLQPAEYQGGTFAITYLGEEHGVKQFSAILHPPQSCVLAVGKTEKRVIPGLEAGQFVLGTYISVTLSCDHRVVDGAIGARWLGAFKDYIENPITLLL